MSGFSIEIYNNLSENYLKAQYLYSFFITDLRSIFTIIQDNHIPEEIYKAAFENFRHDSKTLLHLAVEHNNISLANLILTASELNPFLKDKHNKTAFAYATSTNMRNLLAHHNLLINVSNVTFESVKLINKVAIGINISIDNKNKPDVIKGVKSYQRLVENLVYKRQVDKRLNQYLQANPHPDSFQEKSCVNLVRTILSKKIENNIVASGISYQQKKEFLENREQKFIAIQQEHKNSCEEINNSPAYEALPHLEVKKMIRNCYRYSQVGFVYVGYVWAVLQLLP